MRRQRAILVLSGLCMTLGACASLPDRVAPLEAGVLGEATQARLTELQGLGYPSWAETPQAPEGTRPTEQWMAFRNILLADAERQAADPRGAIMPADPEAFSRAGRTAVDAGFSGRPSSIQDPVAWAAQARARVVPAPSP
jgi:hypothetical protein